MKKPDLSELVKTSGIFIGHEIETEGDIKTEYDVYIDSKFKGQVISEGAVEIGKSSKFTGNVEARTIIVEGICKANLAAHDSLLIAGCSEFNGTASAKSIIIEKGAELNAKLNTEKQ